MNPGCNATEQVWGDRRLIAPMSQVVSFLETRHLAAVPAVLFYNIL